MLVTGIWQSDSVKPTEAPIVFQIIFKLLLQNIEMSFLCCVVALCWLYILNSVLYTCQSQTPNLSLP